MKRNYHIGGSTESFRIQRVKGSVNTANYTKVLKGTTQRPYCHFLIYWARPLEHSDLMPVPGHMKY